MYVGSGMVRSLQQREAALRQLLHGQSGHLLHAEEQPEGHRELDEAGQPTDRVQVVFALEGVIFIFRAFMLERIHRDSAGVEHFLAEVPELLRQRLHFRALAQRVDGEWQAGDAPEDGAGDDRPEPGETYAHVENFEGPAYDAGGGTS